MNLKEIVKSKEKGMHIAIVRWIFFILIGFPLQWLFIKPLYLLIYPIWYLWYFTFLNYKRKPKHDELNVLPIFSTENGILLNSDSHGAFTQYADCTSQGLLQFVDTKDTDPFMNFLRTAKWNKTDKRMYYEVSGDCIVAFCFAAVLPDPNTNKMRCDNKMVKKTILKLASSYLLFLGTRSWDYEYGGKNNGHVSARCNNFGLNLCPDGWLGLGMPCFGPQFFTSSCLFALAAKFSIVWRVVFWLHWILMGGFFWCLMPGVYPKNKLWYVRDIMIKSLYVHEAVFGKRWWILYPMSIINKSTLGVNILFHAIVNKKRVLLEDLPETISPFFSQTAYGESNKDSLNGDCVVSKTSFLKIIDWIVEHK